MEIVGCSIVRESNGLALSSRNSQLSKRLREEASLIFKTLMTVRDQFGTKNVDLISDWVELQFKDHPDMDLEYFTIVDDQLLRPLGNQVKEKKYRAFIAVYAEGIRLIDNVALN